MTVDATDDNVSAEAEAIDPLDITDDEGDLAESALASGLANADDADKDEDTVADTGDDDLDDADADSDPDTISDEMIDRAADSGLTVEDIKLFTSPESLERAIGLAERQQEVTERVQSAEEDAFKLDLDESQHDPEVIKALNAMNEHWQTKFADVQGRLRNEEAIAVERRFDGYIGDLGKSFEKLFGKGQTADLDTKSASHKNRLELITEMEVIQSGREARGLEALDEKSLFNRAKQSVFSDEVTKITKDQIKGEMRKRNKQSLQKPTHRQHRMPEGDAKAISSVAQFLTDKGVVNSPDEEF